MNLINQFIIVQFFLKIISVNFLAIRHKKEPGKNPAHYKLFFNRF